MSMIRLAMPCTQVASSPLRRWAGLLASLLARELQRRREIAWLMQQDDRMLCDLGVFRHEIARIVRHGRDA